MANTNRLQVRDLIDHLSRFDPRDRVAGMSDDDDDDSAGYIEISEPTRGGEMLVTIPFKDPRVPELQKDISDLEAECGTLTDSNVQLENRVAELEAELAKLKK